jgi:hypothetical protein
MVASVPCATYLAHIGNHELSLPVMPMNSEHALALLITVDLEIDVLGEAGRQ